MALSGTQKLGEELQNRNMQKSSSILWSPRSSNLSTLKYLLQAYLIGDVYRGPQEKLKFKR